MKQILFIISLFLLSFAQKPNLLQLKTYKDQNITGWVMSEKLDGIRAYWDGQKLLTRSGKIIHAPKWFTKDYPTFEIDGELWSKRRDFENISSIVRDKIPSSDWKQIKHYIFEVPNAKGGLLERLKKVNSLNHKYIKVIKQIKIKDKNHLQKFLNQIELQNGEGVVVRDPSKPYISKRTSSALKVKNFKDTECEVIGYTKGKGKFTGLVGAVKCKLENGIMFKIGSGFSLDERKNPPKIGDIITFKYKEFTKYGKPRFPTYLRIRYKNDFK
ncbi:MAG: DNA ligase [Campylobacterota bacterium]|nr:DNA ligase [Campylobacterota bacterium]